MSEKKQEGRKSIVDNIILACIVLAAIIYVTIAHGRELTDLFRDPEKFRAWMHSYGFASAFIFIGLQVLQVVVAAIPGEFTQIAGGYVYGTFLGTFLTVTGIVIGTVIVFFLARFLGFPIVQRFVSKKSLERFNFLMNSKKSEIAMFFLFLVPGLPKDVLTYIAGLTPVKPLRFFIIITIARLPGIIGSSMIGANLQQKDYLPVIILSVVAGVLFILGVLFRNKIIDKVSGMIHKKTDNCQPSEQQQDTDHNTDQ